MAKNGDKGNPSWQDRVHELQFTGSELETIKVLVKADSRALGEVILDLCVDNAAVKVKSVEYFSSYSISYTYDKHHPELGGHTFWFYAVDIEQGVKILSAFLQEMGPESVLAEPGKFGRGIGW